MKYSLVTLASSLGMASAFWRMECPYRSGDARLDPIMNPGGISVHMHSIYGSGGFTNTATFNSLHDASCTSCRVTQDKSAYWTPSLYFQNSSTGEFTEVSEQGGLLAYYFLNYKNITAFPEGFRMIAGNNTRRTFTTGDASKPDPPKSNWAADGITSQTALAERAIGFNCLNYNKEGEETLYRHYLPEKSWLDANCPDGIRIELMFPSCWNGKDLDSTDHQSHVAYPDLVMTGDCPSSHPVGLPGLMFETFFRTQDFDGQAGRFVIANGDTTGFGYHGDFITGWTQSVLQQAVDTCTNPSGLIEDCSVFNVVSKSTASNCKISNVPTAALAATGPLKSLPGNVAITYGNGTSDGGSVTEDKSGSSVVISSTSSAPVASKASSTSIAAPAPATTTSSSVAPLSTIPSSSTVASTSSTSVKAFSIADVPVNTPSPTPTSSVDPDAGKYASTQWVTGADHVVTKILWDQVYVTETTYVDTADATGSPAKAKRAPFMPWRPKAQTSSV